MRTLRITLVVVVASLVGQPAYAQNYALSLFERYLDSLREQTGIPGMSVAILQGGVVVWERGLGKRDLEANLPATPDTPYRLGDLSQVLGATLLLRKCVDQGYLELTDHVVRWSPYYPEPVTSVGALLTHTTPLGGYHRDPARFAALTTVIEQCADAPYRRLLTDELIDRFAMLDAVPGPTPVGASPGSPFDPLATARRARYAAALARTAIPYHLDARGRPSRTIVPAAPLTAASGFVASVRDLARFDAALSAGALLNPATLQAAWTPAVGGIPRPTTLGWFVQGYTAPGRPTEPLVWQFGVTPNASSSLMLKLPRRGLTLILLANSDALGVPFALDNTDVTSSLFARLFLRLLAN